MQGVRRDFVSPSRKKLPAYGLPPPSFLITALRWSTASGAGATQIAQHAKHTEFVCGCTSLRCRSGLPDGSNTDPRPRTSGLVLIQVRLAAQLTMNLHADPLFVSLTTSEGLLMSCGWDGMVHAWQSPV